MMDGEGGRVFFLGAGAKASCFHCFCLPRPGMAGGPAYSALTCQAGLARGCGYARRGSAWAWKAEARCTKGRAKKQGRRRARVLAPRPPLPSPSIKKKHLSHRHSRASSSGVHGSRLADGASGSGRLREGMCVYVRAGASGGKERDVLLSDGSKQLSA